MSRDSHNSKSSSQDDQLDLETIRELHKLFGRAYDEVMTEEELKLLDKHLSESPSARALYYRYVELHALLLTRVGMRQRLEVEVLRRRVNAEAGDESQSPEAASDPVSRVVGPTSVSRPSNRKSIVWAVAVMILLSLTAGVFLFSRGLHRAPNDRVASTQFETNSDESNLRI